MQWRPSALPLLVSGRFHWNGSSCSSLQPQRALEFYGQWRQRPRQFWFYLSWFSDTAFLLHRQDGPQNLLNAESPVQSTVGASDDRRESQRLAILMPEVSAPSLSINILYRQQKAPSLSSQGIVTCAVPKDIKPATLHPLAPSSHEVRRRSGLHPYWVDVASAAGTCMNS